MPRRALLLLPMLASGCAFSTNVKRTAGAPTLPATESAELVHSRPKEALELGTVELQGNNWQSASDCETQLILEARKLGGDLVFGQPQENGIGQGPRCTGVVFVKR